MKILQLLFGSTFLFLSFLAYGQNQLSTYSTEVFTRENGLPGSTVFGICRDKQGLLWVGTDNGVCYYSNSKFWTVSDSVIPKTALRLFPGKDSGVVVLGNIPTSATQVYTRSPSKTLFRTSKMRFSGGLIGDKELDGAFYFSGWKNLFRLKDGELDTLCSIRKTGPKAVKNSEDGQLYYISEKGLFEVDNDTISEVWAGNVTSALITSHSEYELFSESLYRKYVSGKLTSSLPVLSDLSQSLILPVRDSKGSIWVAGHYKGVYEITNGTVYDVGKSIGMPNSQITYIFPDNGNIWMATNEDGIILIKGATFQNFSSLDGLEDNYIKCIAAFENNRQFITSKKGAYIVDSNKRIAPFDLKTNYLDVSLLSSTIKDAIEFNGDVIIASNQAESSSIYPDKVIAAHRFIKKDNCLHVGSYSWILTQCGDSTSRARFTEGVWGGVNDLLAKGPLIYLASDMLCGYIDVTLGNDQKVQILNKGNGPYTGLAMTSDGIIWYTSINTLYKGLYVQTNPKEVLSSINGENLLIRGLEIDDQDRIWMATQLGLVLYENGQTCLFTESNGLIDKDIKKITLNQDGSELWLGTSNGLSVLNINELTKERVFRYSTQVRQLSLSNGRAIPLHKAHDLSNIQNNLKISLAVKGYSQHLPISYQYRLVTNDSTWHNTDGIIDLFALSFGEYALETRATTSGSCWSSPSTFHFKISRPFWRRWEFFLLTALVLIGLITLIYSLRYRSLKKLELEKRRIQEQINQLELQALNANMNPHFLFNALNSIQHYLMPLKNREALDYISNLSMLIRMNMQALGKRTVRLDGELNRLAIYIELEKKRFDDKLSFSITKTIESDVNHLNIPSMIIQPLVENAIWHGIAPKDGNGHLNIELIEKDGILYVEVVDNGIGLAAASRKTDKGHESAGTQLIRKILLNHHPKNSLVIEEIYDREGQSSGTRAFIRLHLDK